MEDVEYKGTVKLLAKAQVPFYFKTNDKVAWIIREDINLAVIVRTSDRLEDDYSPGATRRVDVSLKFLNLQSGDIESEFSYNLVFRCTVLEIVCDLTATCDYPLLNVFARLEDFRICVLVFSCPDSDHKDEKLHKEMELILDKCRRQNSNNFHWGGSVNFMKVSALRRGRYWLGVILNGGQFILLEIAVEEKRLAERNRFQIHCVRHIRSDEMELMNHPFSWKLLDFSPDQKSIAIIGRGSYVFFIGLVFIDVESFTVIAETQLKGYHFVADAKYSKSGNFFFALCSGQRIKMPSNDENQSVMDFEDCKSVLIWDTCGNLLQKVNIEGHLASSVYEFFLSPYDNYIVIPQSGTDSNKRQFAVFLKHEVNLSKQEAEFDAEELLQMDHRKGTDNYTSCTISPNGHQLLVTHCCNVNMEDRSQDISNLLVFKMNDSPAKLRVLCRMAIKKNCVVQNLRQHDVPKEILSYLNWC